MNFDRIKVNNLEHTNIKNTLMSVDNSGGVVCRKIALLVNATFMLRCWGHKGSQYKGPLHWNYVIVVRTMKHLKGREHIY